MLEPEEVTAMLRLNELGWGAQRIVIKTGRGFTVRTAGPPGVPEAGPSGCTPKCSGLAEMVVVGGRLGRRS
jgi:hypothetical protein